MGEVGDWTFEPADPSVGIPDGMWIHEVNCTDPDGVGTLDASAGTVTCRCGAILDLGSPNDECREVHA